MLPDCRLADTKRKADQSLSAVLVIIWKVSFHCKKTSFGTCPQSQASLVLKASCPAFALHWEKQ